MRFQEFKDRLRANGVSVNTLNEWHQPKVDATVILVNLSGQLSTTAMVHDYGPNGFEIYLPASDSNKVDATLDAVLSRLFVDHGFKTLP